MSEMIVTLVLKPFSLYGQNQQMTIDDIFFFLSFSQKIGCDILYKLSPKEAICIKCQILFSEKKKEKKKCTQRTKY